MQKPKSDKKRPYEKERKERRKKEKAEAEAAATAAAADSMYSPLFSFHCSISQENND